MSVAAAGKDSAVAKEISLTREKYLKARSECKGDNGMAFICPNCGIQMVSGTNPDIATDECPQCGGIFLDRGELNMLATGMAGDIEYCSIDADSHKDRVRTRPCPRCRGEAMEKINLLRFTEVIFDYCPKCGGFFLDKGEAEQMNAALAADTPSGSPEEYRGVQAGHLVRVDQVLTVVAAGGVPGITTGVGFAQGRYIRVTIFFQPPLPVSLRIFRESWPVRLEKALHLFFGQDIATGDEEFDAVYRVQGENKAQVLSLLTPEAREALLRFVKKAPSIFGRPGSLDISSSAVTFLEGPYAVKGLSNVVKKAEPVRDELLAIAQKFQSLA